MIRQRDVTPECWAKLQEIAHPTRPAPPPDEPKDEKAFMADVVAFAEKHGWVCFHNYDARKSMAGYPDLTCVRERVVWIELKTEAGRLTASQESWRDWLQAAGAEWYCLRPGDWPEVERVLGSETPK